MAVAASEPPRPSASLEPVVHQESGMAKPSLISICPGSVPGPLPACPPPVAVPMYATRAHRPANGATEARGGSGKARSEGRDAPLVPVLEVPYRRVVVALARAGVPRRHRVRRTRRDPRRVQARDRHRLQEERVVPGMPGREAWRLEVEQHEHVLRRPRRHAVRHGRQCILRHGERSQRGNRSGYA